MSTTNKKPKKTSPNLGKVMVDPNDLQSLIERATKKNWSDDWLKNMEKSYLNGNGSRVSSPFFQSSLVNTCIKIIGRNFPQATFEVYRGDRLAPEGDPVKAFFENPSKTLSRFEFWEAVAASFSLYGESFVYLVPSVRNVNGLGGLPSEMMVLDPRAFTEVVDPNTGDLKGWMFKGKQKQIPFTTDEIMHFKSYNPNNPYRGGSPIDSIQLALNSDFSSEKYNERFFVNGAAPLGIISMGEDQDDSIEEMKKIMKLWNQAHRSVDKAHKVGILRHGMTFSPMGLSQKDMDFISGRKFSREQILSAFGVPPTVAGFFDESQYSSAKTSKGIFWSETLKPMGIRFQETMKKNFFMIYAPGYSGVFSYKTIEELTRDYKIRTEEAKDLFTMGVPFNKINERLDLGFEPLDGHDTGYVPVSFIPLEEAGELYNPKDSDITGTPDEEKSFQNNKIDKDSSKSTTKNRRIQRMIHRKMDEYERPFQSKLKRYFFEQRKQMLQIVFKNNKNTQDSMQLITDLNIFEDENKKLIKTLGPFYKEIVQSGQELALEILGLSRDVILNEDIIIQKINRIQGINNTIYKQIKKTVFEGVDSGESIDMIANRIKSVYNVATNRTKLIARTEVTQALSEATMFEYKNAGVLRHEWLSAGDEEVRDSHIANQEVGPIPVGDTFPSGERYPGENSPNCRCTLIPVIGG